MGQSDQVRGNLRSGVVIFLAPFGALSIRAARAARDTIAT